MNSFAIVTSALAFLLSTILGCENADEGTPVVNSTNVPSDSSGSDASPGVPETVVSCENSDIEYSARAGQLAATFADCKTDSECAFADPVLHCTNVPVILGTCGWAIAKSMRTEFEASIDAVLGPVFCVAERAPCTATGGCPPAVPKCSGGLCTGEYLESER